MLPAGDGHERANGGTGFPPGRFAFVDLETTGTDPSRDRITEVAVVEVVDGEVRQRWSQLLDPGRPIPAAIQNLTGITDALVRHAPTFSSIAPMLLERLQGRIFVAHNARFDYGFLKAEFRRLGLRFQAQVLCTLRLSRQLYPQAERHGLDALISRHRLPSADRHRALGDADLIVAFVGAAVADHGREQVAETIRQLLRQSALPPNLPEHILDEIPDGPGVYTFVGAGGQPLYVGKAINLSARIRQHFYADSRNAVDGRLSSEVHDLQIEETAGEVSALVREILLIRQAAPLHNRLLRRKDSACFIRMSDENEIEYLPLSRFQPGSPEAVYGPFGTQRSARDALAALGKLHRLCDRALGLWSGDRPCFSFQIGRCMGLCCGKESGQEHHQRLTAALESLRLPDWPFSGSASIDERNPDSGLRNTLYFDQWCVIDPARPLVREFDPDMYRLLRKAIRSGKAVGAMTQADRCAST